VADSSDGVGLVQDLLDLAVSNAIEVLGGGAPLTPVTPPGA